MYAIFSTNSLNYSIKISYSFGLNWVIALRSIGQLGFYYMICLGWVFISETPRCNVFLWFGVIYISLSLSLCLSLSFACLMFCFRILYSTQVPQSFLFVCALFRFTRFASSTPLLTTLFLHTCCALFLSFTLSPSPSAYTDNGNGSGRSFRSPFPFASQFLQLRFAPTFASKRKIRKHITTNALGELLFRFFALLFDFRFAFLHFYTMFSPSCALAFVFVLSLLPWLPLWAAAVGLSARKLHNRRECFAACDGELIRFHSRDLCCTVALSLYI